jgi:predicted DNA-binding transcriptional regulator AlpA
MPSNADSKATSPDLSLLTNGNAAPAATQPLKPEHTDAVAVPPLVYDTADLCAVLRISPATLHRLRAAGKLPRAMRLGSQLRFLASEIQEWCEAGMPDQRAWEAIKAVRNPGTRK